MEKIDSFFESLSGKGSTLIAKHSDSHLILLSEDVGYMNSVE